MTKTKNFKAPIAEIFTSIQGEGMTSGTPSIFVRFYGCNLRCSYCDTPYAVNEKQEESAMMSTFAVYRKLKQEKPTNIVFTGGEPMLYQEFIIEVMAKLNKRRMRDYSCEVETNGTIKPIPCFVKYVGLFNISPKLSNSGQNENDCIKDDVLKRLYLPHKALFKFVVNKEDDMKEVLKICNKYPKMVTYLMPKGETKKKQIRHMPRVIKLCLKYGMMFSPRVHVLVWDKKRGV